MPPTPRQEHHTLRRTRAARVAATAAVAALLAGLAAGCAAGEPDGATEVATPTTVAETTTTTRAVLRQACTAANLTAAAAVRHPGSEALDQSCSSTWAMATIQGGDVPEGALVGYFRNDDTGTWVLVQEGSVTADQLAEAPEGMPQSVILAWRRTHDLRLAGGVGTQPRGEEQLEQPLPEEPLPEEFLPEEPPVFEGVA